MYPGYSLPVQCWVNLTKKPLLFDCQGLSSTRDTFQKLNLLQMICALLLSTITQGEKKPSMPLLMFIWPCKLSSFLSLFLILAYFLNQGLKTFASHSSHLHSMAWHPSSSNFLVTASLDKTAKLWDVRSSVPLHTLEGHQEQVRYPFSVAIFHINLHL